MMERFCKLRSQIQGQSVQLAEPEPGKEEQEQQQQGSSKDHGAAGAVDASDACPASNSMEQPAGAQLTYLQLKHLCSPGYYACWAAMLQADAMDAWLRKPVHLQQFS